MKIKILLSSAILCTSFLLTFQVNGNVKSDLNSGLLPIEAARKAHSNDEQSQNVVQQLVDENIDVVKAVQTVAKEWSSCEDTYASVRKGVQLSPSRADEIVASVATISGCRCNAQSFWARSRLEQRLRPRVHKALVEIGSTCSCAAAGIEAAMEIVPDQTEQMIDAVIVAKNRAERTVDSIGQIGNLPEQKFWGTNLINTKNTNLIRNSEVCKGDHDEMNEFNPDETWSNSNKANPSAVFNSNKELGKHKLICKKDNDDNDDNDDNETKEQKDQKLIISQYIEGQGNNQALELYNGTNKPIDLLLNNYQLEIYFHGYEFPGEIIQLKGLIEPQETFVVSDANAAADIAKLSNQKVNGLIFKGADAVVLKTGFDNNPCECSVATVAAAINGFEKENNSSNTPLSQDKKDFIQRIEKHYENTNIQATVVDSIGQILKKSNDRPITSEETLRRSEDTCKGDRVEMDDFQKNKEWKSYAKDNFFDSGSYNQQDCLASRKDLLLSEYIEGSGNNDMIEIYNGTDRPINFNNEKYFLEIYQDDDENPDQKIPLKGSIDRNGVFVVTHDDAEKALKKTAQQTSGELNLKNARAVVLKKVVLPAYQSCYADIAIWIENYNYEDITYILTPTFDPGIGPITIDDPRDGDDGGELASPN